MRQTAKVIIAESLGRQWCKGEEECIKFRTAQDKTTVCKGCPHNFSKSKLSDIEGSFVVIPWLSHLFYLDGLRRVGAVFHVDDLSRQEWDGLILIEAVRADVERERFDKAQETAKLDAAMKRQGSSSRRR